jgi:hypothetical protein
VGEDGLRVSVASGSIEGAAARVVDREEGLAHSESCAVPVASCAASVSDHELPVPMGKS